MCVYLFMASSYLLTPSQAEVIAPVSLLLVVLCVCFFFPLSCLIEDCHFIDLFKEPSCFMDFLLSFWCQFHGFFFFFLFGISFFSLVLGLFCFLFLETRGSELSLLIWELSSFLKKEFRAIHFLPNTVLAVCNKFQYVIFQFHCQPPWHPGWGGSLLLCREGAPAPHVASMCAEWSCCNPAGRRAQAPNLSFSDPPDSPLWPGGRVEAPHDSLTRMKI